MSKDSLAIPVARTWRDIPQEVRPRAMSREGRRRVAGRAARLAAALATLAAVAWCSWKVAASLRDSRSAPAAAQAEPIGERVVLRTDGVLDRAWLVRALALPPGATLLSIDPAALQARVLSDGQVLSAAVTRQFPATLAVRVSERSPVAAVLASAGGGEPKQLLVARDGTVFEGKGYDPAMLRTLPWLDGVRLVRRGSGFAPIEGMDRVGDLVARAKFEAEHLYSAWRVLSLSRLASDGVIEARTREGLRIAFGTQEDYFRQLARLDAILDAAAVARPGQPVTGSIDLSLGSQVPVRLEPSGAPVAAAARPAVRPPAPAPAFRTVQLHPQP